MIIACGAGVNKTYNMFSFAPSDLTIDLVPGDFANCHPVMVSRYISIDFPMDVLR